MGKFQLTPLERTENNLQVRINISYSPQDLFLELHLNYKVNGKVKWGIRILFS